MLEVIFVTAVFTAIAIFMIEAIKFTFFASRAPQSVILKSAAPVTFRMPKVSAKAIPTAATARTFFGSPVDRNTAPVIQEAKKNLFDGKPFDYSVYDSPAYIRKAEAALAAQQASSLKRLKRKK